MGLLLCKWWVAAWLTFFHPFYVSVTEVRHNASRQTLEISCRIFADDLENALKSQYKVPFDIIHPADRKKANELLYRYLGQHLRLTVNDQPVNYQFVGYQIEEEAAWCFLEVTNVSKPVKLGIRNDILYLEHTSQVNMIHAIVNNQRKSTKLDNPEASAVFNF